MPTGATSAPRRRLVQGPTAFEAATGRRSGGARRPTHAEEKQKAVGGSAATHGMACSACRPANPR
jgi:hypothetical protein